MAEDHVFLQAAQFVSASGNRGFGQHLRRFLEGCRRDPRFRLQTGSRDTQEHRACGRGTTALGHDFLVLRHEFHAALDVGREIIAVARIFDLHFPHHLADQDFDVLVVDAYGLTAVHGLHFVEDVRLQLVFAIDAQNVVRDQRAVHQAVAGAHFVTLADENVLALRHQMFHFQARIRLDDQRALATLAVAEVHHAVDFRHDRGVLRAARFEQFRDARQTAGDVLRSGHFARRFREQLAGDDLLSFDRVDDRFFRNRVDSQDHAIGVFDYDLRMMIAAMFDDDLAFVARSGVGFFLKGHVFDEVFERDFSADFGQDRDIVRIPLDQRFARRNLFTVDDLQHGAGLNDVLFEFAILFVDNQDFGVAIQNDIFTLFVDHRLAADQLDDAGRTRLDFGFFDRFRAQTADVEGTHRQLRARFADGLRGDDTHRRADFHQPARRHVHAVALRAAAQLGFAQQRRAHADLAVAAQEIFDLLPDLRRDQLAFHDDLFAGHQMHDLVASRSPADRIRQRHFDLLATIHRTLRQAVERAAIRRRDYDVLRDFDELAGQVAGIRRLQRGVGQSLAGAVR